MTHINEKSPSDFSKIINELRRADVKIISKKPQQLYVSLARFKGLKIPKDFTPTYRDSLIALREYRDKKVIMYLKMSRNGQKEPKENNCFHKEAKPFKRPIDFYSTNEFLESYQWRRIRYSALKNSDGRCSLCGRGSKDGVVLNVDHILPRKRYPELSLDINNLQVLCHECNHGKGNIDNTDWRR